MIALRIALRTLLAALLAASIGWLAVEAAPGPIADRAARAAGLLPQDDSTVPRWLRDRIRSRVARDFEIEGSMPARLLSGLGALASPSMGTSWRDRAAVSEHLAGTPASLILVLSALFLGGLVGVWLALQSLARGRDAVVAIATAVALSVPPVWLALLAARSLAHGYPLSLFPPGGWAGGAGLILPVLVLAVVPAAVVARHARAHLEEHLSEPWARAAKARGLTLRQLRRQALRLAAPGLLALSPALTAYLFGALLVVESVFALDGLGRSLLDGARAGDAPVVIAGAALTAAVVTLVGAAAAALSKAADPRLREVAP